MEIILLHATLKTAVIVLCTASIKLHHILFILYCIASLTRTYQTSWYVIFCNRLPALAYIHGLSSCPSIMHGNAMTVNSNHFFTQIYHYGMELVCSYFLQHSWPSSGTPISCKDITAWQRHGCIYNVTSIMESETSYLTVIQVGCIYLWNFRIWTIFCPFLPFSPIPS
jgi:hypothetical protein